MTDDQGKPLTDQQRDVFKFLKQYLEENGYAPLYREIQEGADLTNVGLVYKNLEALQKKGYILKEENKKRGIELTDVGKEVPLEDIPGQLNLFDDFGSQ
ncbi:MAG: LexA family protein [bacterium]